MKENYKKITKEEIALLPFINFEGETQLVISKEKCIKVMEYLNAQTLVGFDTECRPAFTKGESYDISLLQLSTDDQAYLFRLNKFEMPDELIEFLSNPDIIKTGVAIRDDIKGLKKLRPFKDQGFVELQTIAKERNIENFGLRGLTAVLFGKRLSKRAQVSNWEQDKLSPAQVKYAATDAWIGLQIYNKFHS